MLGAEVYTPALVVNGAAMVVGSDRSAVRRAIEQTPAQALTVVLRRGRLGLEAEIEPTTDQMTGLLATYDPEAATQVGPAKFGPATDGISSCA